jgi:phosphoribosylcarboxyaminoimidazole (NCAIR) mutase
MEFTAMDEAIKQIEKSNIDLEPEVLDAHTLQELLSRYAKAKKLVSTARPCWRQSSTTLR